ncbi:hypothetical protein FC40_GL001185 [Ligilactobacillus hayakitensis DSM 18933 = JCM 14209]|uniref:Uncharacterized protein n=1 Tax=Ligilactobacillus hayakitensis DSM 18933 = JCM 14209 TaxID=1423755 RepID=A0A0R1WJ12_9LACO|nr:hypothetical protein [Ligilactobacillus hayakitensis]KRM17413.1 hypothetical protein FC40_GL001185 [Ligilactobacillus hayakitensis DSM 18933 = JCM 14209]
MSKEEFKKQIIDNFDLLVESFITIAIIASFSIINQQIWMLNLDLNQLLLLIAVIALEAASYFIDSGRFIHYLISVIYFLVIVQSGIKPISLVIIFIAIEIAIMAQNKIVVE